MIKYRNNFQSEKQMCHGDTLYQKGDGYIDCIGLAQALKSQTNTKILEKSKYNKR